MHQFLKVETVSDMNEGAAVEGERIRYTVRVTNEGRSVSEDVIVNSIIPESTTYVNDNGELEPDTDSLKIEIGSVYFLVRLLKQHMKLKLASSSVWKIKAIQK